MGEDIAFVIKVTKSGFTDQDLGTNTVTMTVSSAWYDQRLAEDKEIAVTKLDDEGGVFATKASYAMIGEQVSCSAVFSGPAEGFSTFALVAIVPAPEPVPVPVLEVLSPTPTTAVPTPSLELPTATPTASSTPLPTPLTTPHSPSPTATGEVATPIAMTLTPTVTLTPGGSTDGSPYLVMVWVFAIVVALGGGGIFLIRRRQVKDT